MDQTRPYEGLLVVDFTHVLAGPACAYYLGLLGADVIKVESTSKGDAMRHRGGTDPDAMAEGMSTAYLTQGSAKRALALDLDTPDGQERFHQLLARADILVENHVPQTLQRLGLDEATLAKRHPHLIHCAMTGYGRGGPQEATAAYDVNIQASCGLMEMTGTQESGPMRTGPPVLDYATAMAAAFAISAALYERAKTGQGAFVDVSMLETGFALMSANITDYLQTGNAPKRRGNKANSRSPSAGSFACKEGVMSLGVNEPSQLENLARALGRTDWLSDPRFADAAARKANAEAFAAQIADALSAKTAQEWEPILQNAGVPCARLRSLPEALASDHAQARGFVQSAPDGVRVPTLPFRLNGGGPFAPNHPAPTHGADTDDILAWLDGEGDA